MQAVAALPLIKDILNLSDATERDLVQLLKVDDGCGDISVLAQGEGVAAGEGDDDGVTGGKGRRLRAMCWRLHTLVGGEATDNKMADDIDRVYDGEEKEGGGAEWSFGSRLRFLL
jgi:hypothetical protein